MRKHLVKKKIRYVRTCVLLLILFTLPFSSSYGQVKKKLDTLKMANQLIAERKFAKVNVILSKYRKSHPKDFNAIFLLAQTELWSNNFRKSNALYKEALKMQPDNGEVKSSYIQFLLDLGKFDTAAAMLAKMDEQGNSEPTTSIMMTRLYYWQGNYPKALEYVNKALQEDSKNNSAKALEDEIELAKAPRISLNTGYVSDNQPYKALTSSLRYDQSFHRLLSLYINVDDYRFMQGKTFDAQRVTIGDNLSFPKIGLQLGVNGGMVKYAYQNMTDWTAGITATQKITHQVNLEIAAERGPYFDTKTSVDTNITAIKLSSKLNWNKRYWKAQVAYLANVYADDNYVNSAYAWIIAPIEVSDNAQFHLGYSLSYSNAYDSRYSATESASQILSHYPDLTITGLYQPYFTPRNLWVNSVIAVLHAKLSKKMDLGINADVGYATISNPYLFLSNSTGDVTIKRDYTTAFFKPFNATVTLGYHLNRSWMLTGRYMYKSNYFYSSNFVGISVEKSFLKKKKKDEEKATKSAFLKKVHELENKLHQLYKCKDADELRREVAKIKEQLVTLRDEQKEKKSMSEVLPDSDEAGSLDDRYESLSDMLDEINAIELGDSKGAANKNEWLVRKAYQFSTISYAGATQE